MIFQTNSKLKKDKIFKFSLPYKKTCPGKGDCEDYCLWINVLKRRGDKCIDAHERNLKLSLERYFPQMCHIELEQSPRIEFVRWQDTGDVYSQYYLDKLQWVAHRTPDVFHYLYTKSLHLKWDKWDGLKNTKRINSFGGKYDNLIDRRKPHSILVEKGKPIPDGYTDCTESDMLAVNSVRIALYKR